MMKEAVEMSDSNREILRRALEGFASGNANAYVEIFSDDVVYHYPGQNPLSGDYRGRDEVLGFIERVDEWTEGTFTAELHDVLGSDQHAASLSTVSAQRNGRSLEWRAINIYDFADGRVTEVWIQPIIDQAVLDQFLS
jgi:ketosteroid isomerase-like protein